MSCTDRYKSSALGYRTRYEYEYEYGLCFTYQIQNFYKLSILLQLGPHEYSTTWPKDGCLSAFPSLLAQRCPRCCLPVAGASAAHHPAALPIYHYRCLPGTERNCL